MSQESGTMRPGRFGPYHRLWSPTQTDEDARQQLHTGELWGRTPRDGLRPTVQAYRGELPLSALGIEFFTDVEPDSSAPPGQVRWSGERAGVTIDGDFAIIRVVVVRTRSRR